MKKLILIFSLFISSLGIAQQEVKIDIADALVIRSLEFSYENYMNAESSLGVSVLFNLEDQAVDFRYNENTMITPYFRNYFTLDAQWNIFGEAFLSVNSGKIRVETANANPNESLYKKYMTKGADYNPQKASLFAETIFTPMGRPAMRQRLLDQQYSKKDYAGFIDNPSGFDFSIFQQ